MSWKNKYIDRDKSKGRKYPKMFDGFMDAWHLFNNSAYYLLIIAIVFSLPLLPVNNLWLLCLIKIIIGVTIHIQAFNLFYLHIFKLKK